MIDSHTNMVIHSLEQSTNSSSSVVTDMPAQLVKVLATFLHSQSHLNHWLACYSLSTLQPSIDCDKIWTATVIFLGQQQSQCSDLLAETISYRLYQHLVKSANVYSL